MLLKAKPLAMIFDRLGRPFHGMLPRPRARGTQSWGNENPPASKMRRCAYESASVSICPREQPSIIQSPCHSANVPPNPLRGPYGARWRLRRPPRGRLWGNALPFRSSRALKLLCAAGVSPPQRRVKLMPFKVNEPEALIPRRAQSAWERRSRK